MKTIIERIRENKVLSVLISILLAVVIFKMSMILAKPVNTLLGNYFELSFYTKNIALKLFILVFSLIAILLVNKGKLIGYGFVKPVNTNYFKMIWKSVLFIFGAFIVGQIIFNGVLRNVFGSDIAVKGFPKENSVIEMILVIWIWSSICEEVLTRGLVQGFLNKHVKLKFLKLSLPVWVSGLVFGVMHITMARTMDPFMGAFIVFYTTSVGLYMAYYREKSQSIYPAMAIHILTNVVGTMPYFIMQSMQ